MQSIVKSVCIGLIFFSLFLQIEDTHAEKGDLILIFDQSLSISTYDQQQFTRNIFFPLIKKGQFNKIVVLGFAENITEYLSIDSDDENLLDKLKNQIGKIQFNGIVTDFTPPAVYLINYKDPMKQIIFISDGVVDIWDKKQRYLSKRILADINYKDLNEIYHKLKKALLAQDEIHDRLNDAYQQKNIELTQQYFEELEQDINKSPVLIDTGHKDNLGYSQEARDLDQFFDVHSIADEPVKLVEFLQAKFYSNKTEKKNNDDEDIDFSSVERLQPQDFKSKVSKKESQTKVKQNELLNNTDLKVSNKDLSVNNLSDQQKIEIINGKQTLSKQKMPSVSNDADKNYPPAEQFLANTPNEQNIIQEEIDSNITTNLSPIKEKNTQLLPSAPLFHKDINDTSSDNSKLDRTETNILNTADSSPKTINKAPNLIDKPQEVTQNSDKPLNNDEKISESMPLDRTNDISDLTEKNTAEKNKKNINQTNAVKITNKSSVMKNNNNHGGWLIWLSALLLLLLIFVIYRCFVRKNKLVDIEHPNKENTFAEPMSEKPTMIEQLVEIDNKLTEMPEQSLQSSRQSLQKWTDDSLKTIKKIKSEINRRGKAQYFFDKKIQLCVDVPVNSFFAISKDDEKTEPERYLVVSITMNSCLVFHEGKAPLKISSIIRINEIMTTFIIKKATISKISEDLYEVHIDEFKNKSADKMRWVELLSEIRPLKIKHHK